MENDVFNRIKSNLQELKAYDKEYYSTARKTAWFRPENVSREFMPVIREKVIAENAWEIALDVIHDLIYNPKHADIKQLQKLLK